MPRRQGHQMLDNWYCPTTADIRSAWCPVDYYYPLSKAAFLQLLIKGRPIVRVGSLHCSQTHSVSQRHPDPNTPLWNDGKFKSPHTLSPCLISQTLALCFFFSYSSKNCFLPLTGRCEILLESWGMSEVKTQKDPCLQQLSNSRSSGWGTILTLF